VSEKQKQNIEII